MEKFMNFMSEKVAPKLQKVAGNEYVSGLQSAILKTVPMVFVSSLVTVYNVVKKYITTLPDLSDISNYTFGLISLFMAFLVPYYILEKKHCNKMKFVGGMTGISLYMILVNPKVTSAGYVYTFSNFGAGGMFVAIIAGIFTTFVFSLFSKFTVFGQDSAMPDFCKEWFDTMLPIAIVVFVGWLLVIRLKIDLYTVIVHVFMPIVNISNSYVGILLLYMVPTILYSMGISGWVFQPILNPVANVALAANLAAHQANAALPYVYVGGVSTAYLSLGGRGVTFMLVIYFFLSKSKQLKALGSACFVPNLLNINEPIVFGAIAWNPILMVPMWLNSFVVLTVTYIALRCGLVPIPYEAFSLWYLPIGITSFLVSGSISGIILCLVNLGLSAVIWYPFFKIHEKQIMAKEIAELEERKLA